MRKISFQIIIKSTSFSPSRYKNISRFGENLPSNFYYSISLLFTSRCFITLLFTRSNVASRHFLFFKPSYTKEIHRGTSWKEKLEWREARQGTSLNAVSASIRNLSIPRGSKGEKRILKTNTSTVWFEK